MIPASGASQRLAEFFRPRNVALVGATDKSEWSRMIHSRFERFGHVGSLYAVNRNGSPAHGVPGYASCADIPAPVDMAYIFVPASAVAAALRDAGAAGIRNAVVLTSGFAETGAEGGAMQQDVLAAARESGILMMGPNSLGFANIAARCVTTTINTRLPLYDGRLAIVCQSGALANEFAKFAHVQGVGLSFIAATGNEAQMGIADVVDYLVDDEATGAIALYVESINDPARFVASAARALVAAKPIVLQKLGRSPVSAEIARAHTGSLVGDDRVFDAMCRRYGIVRAVSIEETVLTANFLERVGPIDPPRIGMASISGGACGMYAELAHQHGLAMPSWTEETKSELRAVLPPYATTLNPLDVTGQVVNEPAIWLNALPIVLRDPGFGLVVTFPGMPSAAAEVPVLRAGIEAIVAGFRAAGRKPVAGAFAIEDVSGAQRAYLEELGLASTLPNLEFGVRVLAHLQRWSERVLEGPPIAAPAAGDGVPPMAGGPRPDGERATLAYLASHGVPVIPGIVARDAEAAVEAVRALDGVPAVLKIASPDIAHKTEAGGVRLNVSGAEEGRRAFAEIVAAARAHSPAARIEGVIVSPMRGPALELIVGVARDPQWGPAIAVGLGGLFAEALDDVRVSLLPVDRRECRDMLLSLRGAKLLQGFRGSAPADIDRLCETVVAIGRAALAIGSALVALEVNPLRVDGAEIEALDALAVYGT